MAENQHSALLCTIHQTVHEWSVGGFDLFQIYIYNDKRSKLAKFKRLRQELAEMESQREGKHNLGSIISRDHKQTKGKPHNSTGEDMLN